MNVVSDSFKHLKYITRHFYNSPGQNPPSYLSALLCQTSKPNKLPWLETHVVGVSLMHQGCRFDPWSGHIQESVNECTNKWNNKAVSLSLPLFLSKNRAWLVWLSWFEHGPVKWRVMGLIPIRGVHTRGNKLIITVSFPLSLPSPLFKINEHVLKWG